MAASFSTAEWLALLLAIFPLVYANTWMHELGHAVCGRLAGFVVTSCGTGVSRPLGVLRLGGTCYYLARGKPMQGITFVLIPYLLSPRGRLLLLLGGGILAHAVLALASLLLLWLVPFGQAAWWLLLAINVLSLLLNLVPITIRLGPGTIRSDGGQMLAVLRHGGVVQPPRDHVLLAATLRGLFADVGDALMLRAYLLNAVTGWLDLGAPAAARQTLSDAEAAECDPPPWMRAYALLVRASVAAAEKNPDAAEAALVEAQTLFASLGHQQGLLLGRLRRVAVLRARGETAAVLAQIDELTADPTLRPWPYLLPELHALRLTCQLALPDADLASLRGQHEALLGRHPSDARELRFYRHLAAVAEGRGEAALAQEAYGRAVAVVKRLDRDWGDAPTREAFRQAQAGLLADARACHERLGSAAEAEAVAALFAPRKEDDGTVRLERRNKVHHNVGLLLAVATLVAIAVALPKPERIVGDHLPALLAAAVATTFSTLALCYNLALWLLGMFLPWFRKRGGALTWMLVLIGLVLAGTLYVLLPDGEAIRQRLVPQPPAQMR